MSEDNAPRPRLCHVKRWSTFQGYGFNLHAEKGKVGQFIGKVDIDSPAAYAGLKEDDRIVEVNGTNISNENHGQVVQRIKAVPNETKLLVVDKDTDDYYKKKRLVVRSDLPGVLRIECPDERRTEILKHEEPEVEVNEIVAHEPTPVENGDVEDEAMPYPRLCILRIWPDFQGYGFNLHAEKGQQGQYIGKVDEGSPAEAAGLKEKDRIIEVNDDNVVGESHAQTVGRIKANPNIVRMLVIEPEAQRYYKLRDIPISGNSAVIIDCDEKRQPEPVAAVVVERESDKSSEKSSRSSQHSEHAEAVEDLREELEERREEIEERQEEIEERIEEIEDRREEQEERHEEATEELEERREELEEEAKTLREEADQIEAVTEALHQAVIEDKQDEEEEKVKKKKVPTATLR